MSEVFRIERSIAAQILAMALLLAQLIKPLQGHAHERGSVEHFFPAWLGYKSGPQSYKISN